MCDSPAAQELPATTGTVVVLGARFCWAWVFSWVTKGEAWGALEVLGKARGHRCWDLPGRGLQAGGWPSEGSERGTGMAGIGLFPGWGVLAKNPVGALVKASFLHETRKGSSCLEEVGALAVATSIATQRGVGNSGACITASHQWWFLVIVGIPFPAVRWTQNL